MKVDKQGNKDERRMAIMQAAYRLFGKVGYVKATMKDIAAEAGVAQGLIGYHFGTKEALLVAVVREWMVHRGMKDAFSRLDFKQPPERLLYEALSHVVQFRKENKEWFTLLVSLYLESLLNKELARELDEIYKEMKLGVLEVVNRLGLNLSGEERETLASAVQAVFDGLTLQTAFEEDGSLSYSARLFPIMDWLVKGTSTPRLGGESG
ncbi:TetR/AcrR family transcriptional regulator [Paenibacillus xylaniclasticus]|uniref:TetR/AcrR family transcriptional regulator n=1 Tax=Paenibacillus xylaniclasticus TaxID=588083 RepID=UPI00177635B2|nr:MULTISPECIES: TetR/AcrR family transcriptional regulator [Paenibacillus]GFN31389.1 TetR family transcriptional regulator [Paenibacillus curdlanolyticus]